MVETITSTVDCCIDDGLIDGIIPSCGDHACGEEPLLVPAKKLLVLFEKEWFGENIPEDKWERVCGETHGELVDGKCQLFYCADPKRVMLHSEDGTEHYCLKLKNN